MEPLPSAPSPSPKGLPFELHVKSVRVVHWPNGGRVVAFTAPHRETTRAAVSAILRRIFGDNALLRRFCSRRQAGEFALFAAASPPLVGEVLKGD